jgi:FKBP-type peptidyl-prolyl cis-trans isomerase
MKNAIFTFLVTAFAAGNLMAQTAPVPAAVAPEAAEAGIAEKNGLKTDAQKLGYAIGQDVGRNVSRFKDLMDVDTLISSINDAMAGKEEKMTQAEISEVFVKLPALIAEGNKKKGDAFLAENKKKKGVIVTDSGLQYEVIKAAEGEKPKATDSVTVHYHGTLMDGTVFDSSVDRGEPTTFPLNGVIPGWTEGVQLMSVGSKYRFTIPFSLAYGERGAGQKIGPNSTLVFDIELIKINNP